jgi:hypothetical protein
MNQNAKPQDTARSPAAARQIRLTIFKNSAGRLSKKYRLNPDGSVDVNPVTTMSAGSFKVVSIDAADLRWALAEIGSTIDTLSSDEAIGLGVPSCGALTGTITTVARYDSDRDDDNDNDAIPRALTHFGAPPKGHYGLVLFDGDVTNGLTAILTGLYPPFADVAVLIRPSASASVKNPKTGKALKTAEHVYAVLDEPARAKEVLAAFLRLAWCGGLGFVLLSTAGTMLARGPIDASVGSLERLSYEGAAVIGAGIERLPRVSAVAGGSGVLGVADLLAYADRYAPQQRFDALFNEAKRDPALVAESEKLMAAHRAEYIERAVATTPGLTPEEVAERYDRADKERETRDGREFIKLTPDWVLHGADGQPFTVADIVRDPAAHHKRTCYDPMEGLNYKSKNCAIIYSEPPEIRIYSFAHGSAFAYFMPLDWTDWSTTSLGEFLREMNAAGAPKSNWFGKSVREMIDELNEKYCIVRDGGKTRVLFFESQVRKVGNRSHERHVPTLMSFDDFANYYLDAATITVGKKTISLGRWWLQTQPAANPGKRKFDGIVFRPDINAEVIDGRINLWRGFGVAEQAGDWSLMRQHIKEVLANGNADHYTYIINWIAWAVQNPADRAEVALVFKGKKGTGKGTLGNCLVILFGQHGVHISSKDHLAGRFNYHLRDACLLFADEAYWPGDRAAEGALMRMITEPDLFIEGKYKDAVTAPNLLHVMMASNEEWVVPAGENERRYAVFDVPDSKMQNHAYFAAIADRMENGGYEAMLYDLRRLDLNGWHPRTLVQSQALLSQQERSLDFFDEWWSTVLDDGVIPGALAKHSDCSPPLEDFAVYDYLREIQVPGLLSRARKLDPHRGRYVTGAAFGRTLGARGCVKTKIAYRDRQRRTWRFPPLKVARAAWEERFPGWQWSEPEIEEWQAGEEEQWTELTTALEKKAGEGK